MSKERTILLTGFPGSLVGEENTPNPTGIVAQQLNGSYIEGFRVDGRVVHERPEDRPAYYEDLLESNRYLAVLALGMTNCKGFRLEKRGINLFDTSSTHDPVGGHRRMILKPGFDAAYYNTSIPYDGLCRVLYDAGFEAENSEDAGTIGCNAAAFSLYSLQRTYPAIPMLFAHTAYNPECREQMTRLREGFADMGCAEKSYHRKWVKPGVLRHSLPVQKIAEGTVVMLGYMTRLAVTDKYLIQDRFENPSMVSR